MKKKELEIIPDHETSLKLLNKDLGAVDSGDAGGVAEDLGHRVYHTTDAKFNKFDKEFIGYGHGESFAHGFYFADKPILEYGDTITCDISYNKPLIVNLENMESVYRFTDLLGFKRKDVEDEILAEDGTFNPYSVKSGIGHIIKNSDYYLGDYLDYPDITKILQSKGYDCLIIENTVVGIKDKVKLDKEYIIFEPEQIEIVNDINEDWTYTDTLLEKHKNKNNRVYNLIPIENEEEYEAFEKECLSNLKENMYSQEVIDKNFKKLDLDKLADESITFINRNKLTDEYLTPVPKNATIVETSEFLRDAKHLKIDNEDIDDLKTSLTERSPESSLGSGVYKFRWSPKKWKSGNRGATRVIYVYINKSNYVYLMKIYKKNEQANLTDKEEKLIKELAKQLRGA